MFLTRSQKHLWLVVLDSPVEREPMSGLYKHHKSMEAYNWNTWPSLNTSRTMKSEDSLREGGLGFIVGTKIEQIYHCCTEHVC